MADSRPAAYEAAAVAPFAVATERAGPHTKLIGLGVFVLTRLLPAPRDAAA